MPILFSLFGNSRSKASHQTRLLSLINMPFTVSSVSSLQPLWMVCRANTALSRTYRAPPLRQDNICRLRARHWHGRPKIGDVLRARVATPSCPVFHSGLHPNEELLFPNIIFRTITTNMVHPVLDPLERRIISAERNKRTSAFLYVNSGQQTREE